MAKRAIPSLILACMLLSPLGAQSPTAVGVAASLEKEVISSNLLTEIFHWFTAKPDPEKKCQSQVSSLYSSLLQLREHRDDLRGDLSTRIEEVRQHKTCSDICARLEGDALHVRNDLERFQEGLDALAQALDQDAPLLYYGARYYTDAKGGNGIIAGCLQVRNPEGITLSALQSSLSALNANTPAFESVLQQYREFVKKHYPDALTLGTTRPAK